MIVSCYSVVIFENCDSERGSINKRSNMVEYPARLVTILCQLINYIKGDISYLCQGFQFLPSSKKEICDLLILYTANSIALEYIYSSYLPAPVKVAWLIVSSYYRHAFNDDDDSSRKNQASFL